MFTQIVSSDARSWQNLPAPVTPSPSDRSDSHSADHRTNYLSGDHQLHAAVLLPARGSVVGSHRLSLSEALCSDRTSRHSLLCQVIANGRAALFGELLIVVVAA